LHFDLRAKKDCNNCGVFLKKVFEEINAKHFPCVHSNVFQGVLNDKRFNEIRAFIGRRLWLFDNECLLLLLVAYVMRSVL